MKKMFKVLKVAAMILLIFGLVACAEDSGTELSQETASEDKAEINIGKVAYPHEWVPVHIIKHVAEEKGYKVNIVDGEVGFMFLGLKQGDIDIYPDIWLPVLHKSYMDKYKDDIELVGKFYEKAPMGVAVPKYSDINSISELGQKSEQIDEKIVGIEPSTGMMLTAENTIKEYGLEDSIELMDGSTPAMLAEVERAISEEKDIAFLAWRPHAMFSKYDIKLLEDPKSVWSADDDNIGVTKNFKEKAPDLYTFLTNLKVSIEEVDAMLYELEESDKDIDQVTKAWVENNKERIAEMFEK